MRRMPIPDRRIFHPPTMRSMGVWGIRPSFPGLSPCPGQVAYVLLTSAPVAASSIATTALPLDLHVLSLSLAFILSQDQTLRCCIIVSISFKIYNENATAIVSSRPGRPSRPVRILCCAVVLPVFRNLDSGTREFPSLSLHCQFPHCKHFNDLALPGHRTRRIGRQKNRSRNLASCESKSDAKLLPHRKPAKLYRDYF